MKFSMKLLYDYLTMLSAGLLPEWLARWLTGWLTQLFQGIYDKYYIRII